MLKQLKLIYLFIDLKVAWPRMYKARPFGLHLQISSDLVCDLVLPWLPFFFDLLSALFSGYSAVQVLSSVLIDSFCLHCSLKAAKSTMQMKHSSSVH